MTQRITAPPTLGKATIAELRARLRGEVTLPGEPEYDARRAVWNGMIDRYPTLIVRCHGAADVIEAVQFARGNNLSVAVRGGGHNVAGHAICDGGMVVDLSAMTSVRVDLARQVVRVEGGATLGDLDHETQAFGLAASAGIVSQTGIGGLTLGGGMGWLTRRYGLACDNLISADVVTASGQLITASEDQHADLFWGLRGGGGNFGIVTSFEFQLHPVGIVLGGLLMYSGSQIHEGLRFYREFCATAPHELTTLASLGAAPPDDFVPPELRGQLALTIVLCHCGGIEAAEETIRPLRTFGPPAVDLVGPMPYAELQTMLDTAYPSGQRYYWKSDYLRDLSHAAISTILGHMAARPSPLSTVDIHQMGGAAGRTAAEKTAFGHRDAPFLINTVASWTSPDHDEANISWARGLSAALTPFSTGAYVNFLSNTSEEAIRAAYEPGTYARLAALKAKYDPTNLFRFNQNIPPRQ